MSVNIGERVNLKWTDFETTVTSSFGVLRKEEDLFDLTLISDDEIQIPAHKLVLSASSTFFKSILKQSSSNHPILFLSGVNSRILQSVLDYIYHGQIEIYKDELKVFLEVAKKFRIDGLLSTHVSKAEFGLKDDIEAEHCKESVKVEPVLQEQEAVPNEDFGGQENIKKSDSWMDQIEGLLFKSSSHPPVVGPEPFVKESQVESDTEEFVEELDEEIDEEELRQSPLSNIVAQDMTEVDEKIEELIVKREGKMGCKVCDYTSSNSGHMKEHVELHIEGVQYSCQYCRKTFQSRGIFRRHQKKQHKIQMKDINDKIESLIKKREGRYHCTVCNYNSRQTTHLREHVEIHVEGLSYPCHFCRKVLRTQSTHRMHLNKYHKLKTVRKLTSNVGLSE